MQLSNATLGPLPASVHRPAYDRSTLETGIVHLGIGAFHRGHQAVYTDGVLGDDRRWGILGVSLRSAETRDALARQDGLYTVATVSGGGAEYRVIGASTGLLVAPEDPAGLVARLAHPHTKIVTLTVTEKGYCHDPANGTLRDDDLGIIHDLAHLATPRTAIGFLVAGLAARRQAGLAPYTVLSCDNLPANGETVQRLVIGFATLVDPTLADWIAAHGAFPSSMVDRIVPATTDDDRASVARVLGMTDGWPIMTEPFSQWVIEDHFSLGRPAWERVGVQLVNDVKPFELMKLRLLNGAHSTLAYLGYLMGHQTVAAAMTEPGLVKLLEGLMFDEVGPTLPPLAGFDLDSYRWQLLERFRNPALKHRTWQIAMDGSQKLPQRLLGSVRARRAAGQSFDRLALGVAAWMRYVTGVDEHGQAIDVRDPLAGRLRAVAEAAGGEPKALCAGLLSVSEVFGHDLPADEIFREAVSAALGGLMTRGARATVAALVEPL